jgi:hypothetical protein
LLRRTSPSATTSVALTEKEVFFIDFKVGKRLKKNDGKPLL